MSDTPAIHVNAALHYVGIRRKVPPHEMGAALGAIYPAVATHLRTRGAAPASAPMMIYTEHDAGGGTFEFIAGYFVEPPVTGAETIESGAIPPGETAELLHIGPYDQLGSTHEKVQLWIRQQGRDAAGPCWDIFVNDPGEVGDPALFRTRVVYLLKPRSQ